MTASIIMVNFNGRDLTCRALESISAHEPGCEVIVVDNGSTDDSLTVIEARFPDVLRIPLGRNAGFGYANNQGAKQAKGEMLLFLNNDAYLTGPVLAQLSGVLATEEHPGMCGPRVEYDDGSFQLSTGHDPSLLGEIRTRNLQKRGRDAESHVHQGVPRQVDWVTGAAMLMPAALFRDLGGFDEKFFMYFEDADLCRRARMAGRSVWYVPGVTIRHSLGGSNTGVPGGMTIEYRRSQLHFYRKHRTGVSYIGLRCYLALKFSLLWLRWLQDQDMRNRAARVLRLALSGESGGRNAA